MPVKDAFKNFSPSPTASLDDTFPITPSDTEDLPEVTRTLMVGGIAGTITYISNRDEVRVLPAAMVVGIFHPVRAKRILATGTDATDIIGGV